MQQQVKLGNEDDARIALGLASWYEYDKYNVNDNLKEVIKSYGWSYLGRGISRVAFKAPDGTTYKVARNWDKTTSLGETFDNEVSNRKEVQSCEKLRSLARHPFIARFFDLVVLPCATSYLDDRVIAVDTF